jgi:predicted metal-dependent HD superfamily phosphohydrolase
MATFHNVKPESKDQQLLIDFDLAILGASNDRFTAYEMQVRAEHAWVLQDLLIKARLNILREFNTRCPIYKTHLLLDLLERRALDNLSYSIGKLSSHLVGQ